MLDDLGVDQKEYEVSFLVAEEGDVAEIEKILLSNNATIATKGAVGMMKLGYPIKKHESAYFGFIHFGATPDVAPKLREALRVSKKVLRSLIVTPPIKTQPREGRVLSRERSASVSINVQQKETKPEVAKVLSNEGLEKELEEILK